MNKILKEYIKNKIKVVDSYLDKLLPPEDKYPETIHKAMRYSIFAGGKRLRPMLVISAFELCNGQGDKILPAACALEMMHTFSLIHDDLPCMDDDDMRRGKPTNHKVFGDAMAVLAGDALCIYAFEILGKYSNSKIVSEVGRALGTGGMLGGQVVDIESEGKKKIDPDVLNFIHTHKTEALITTSLRVGAIIANANNDELKKVTKFGKKIGLAFQIVDDILDVESTTEVLGKNAKSDIAKDKATYPALFGLSESKKQAEKLIKEAKQEISYFNDKSNILSLLADYILTRVN